MLGCAICNPVNHPYLHGLATAQVLEVAVYREKLAVAKAKACKEQLEGAAKWDSSLLQPVNPEYEEDIEQLGSSLGDKQRRQQKALQAKVARCSDVAYLLEGTYSEKQLSLRERQLGESVQMSNQLAKRLQGLHL